MGQWDILEFLGENAGGWFTARQIAEQTDQSFSSVLIGVRRLRKSRMVEFKRGQGQSVSGRSIRRVHAYKRREEPLLRLPQGLQGEP